MDGQIFLDARRSQADRSGSGGSQPSSPRDVGLRAIFLKAKLKPTRQRFVLGALLFGKAHRHVTADELLVEVREAGVPLSVATVYNTLDQFVSAGLIRRIAAPGKRSLFDTDPGDHQHFYFEDDGRVVDIPPGAMRVDGTPKAPEGYKIVGVDVVVRLTRLDQTANVAPFDRRSDNGAKRLATRFLAAAE